MIKIGLLASSIILAAAIFALDWSLPRGAAVGALYIIPLLVVSALHIRRGTVVAASVGSALIMIDYFLSPGSAGSHWMVLFNRGASIFILGTAALLVEFSNSQRDELKILRKLLPICESCRRIHDDDGHWTSPEAFLERHLESKITQMVCPQCRKGFFHKVKEN